VAACAVMALAGVFSVQQGEHGPLVVYKLQLPEQRAPAHTVPALSPSRPDAAPAPHGVFPALLPHTADDLPQILVPQSVVVIPSRAPAILGTVVMPAGAMPAGAMPAGEPPAAAAAEPDWIAEDSITLQQVSDDILWRRDTAERLPESPFAPRF
jgi:hypothetical protein